MKTSELERSISLQTWEWKPDETAFKVDISRIDESYIQSVGSIIPDKITSSSLQWAYDHTPADKKWNDFMVVRVNSEKAIEDDGGTFDGKVIWIVESKIICNQSLFKSSANSNSLFYVKSGGEITELGGVNDFRGYVHVEGTGTVTQAWKGGTFNGAIHYASENANFQFNSGCDLTMNYDTDAIQEFIDMGIVDPRQDLVEKTGTSGHRIRPIYRGILLIGTADSPDYHLNMAETEYLLNSVLISGQRKILNSHRGYDPVLFNSRKFPPVLKLLSFTNR